MKKLWAILVFVISLSLLATSILMPATVNAAAQEKIKLTLFTTGGAVLTETDVAQKAAWEKATNTEIEYQLQPASNYLEKLQLMIVGGSYPDMVILNDHQDANYGTILKQGAQNGVFISVSKYVTKTNSPNILKYSYQSAIDATKILGDDRMFLVPRTTVKRGDGMIVRKDWLKSVGLNINEGTAITLSQFTEMMKRFTLNDPDKNGKNDTVGYEEVAQANGNVAPIAPYGAAFGYKGWENYSDGGKYKYMKPDYSLQGNSKKLYEDYVNYTRDLYKKGYIDPNWSLIKDAVPATTKGYAGIITGFAGHVKSRENAAKTVNPKAQFTYIVGVKDPKSGKYYNAGYSAGIWGGTAITSACKNPERAVNALDWIVSDDGWMYAKYGAPGITYTNTEKGIKINAVKYTSPTAGRGILNAILRRNNDPEFFVDMTLTPTDKIKARKWIGIAMNSYIDSKDSGFIPPITNDPDYITAENQRKQMLTKVILGANTMEDYQKTLENWYSKGGDAYLKQMNEYIEKKYK